MTRIGGLISSLALGMACFTEPSGELGVWIVPSQVVGVTHAHDCAPNAKTKIITGSGTFCVQETPKEVRKRLDENK